MAGDTRWPTCGRACYGYRAVPGKPGELEIVRRSYDHPGDFLQHTQWDCRPREIAQDLNRENIHPPRWRQWNASTINGHAKRGTGLIFNELYAGRIVWNKVRMVRNPDTGKRLSRPNPREEWQRLMCLNCGSSNSPFGSRRTL
ncbi:recombinase family protein [Bradyrhizobium sp. CB3481]|nr:recombinase family protein [Bradyrhizobium sp. CB3481]WFU20477.1 recombinase family protein [Bradyrhizobium sp. CB3481]